MTLKRVLFFFFVLSFVFTPSFSQRSSPRLMADKADIERAKQWMASHAWYRNIVEAHKRECDRFMQRRPVFISPLKQTYEYKMYTCPKHDVELLYEEGRPYEHRCRVDTTESYNGGKYDAAWAGWYNRLVASRLVWMGILYRLYGDDRYAEAGKEILIRFAELYLKYPTSNTILGPAHVFFGTLSESFWGVDMAYGYDLLYDYRGFTEADRTKLREEFFYPLAKITQLFPESASNRQLWYNNVSAAVGFLFDDQELIDFALKGKYGFYWQLGTALPESGFWAEWSGYHFVALRGMIQLAEMARHNGIDLYHLEIAGRSMKKMFDVPFDVILPNYEFPRLKDSGGGNILEYATYYEIGYAAYKDPKYLALLNLTNVVRGKQVVGETSALGEADAPVTMFNLEPELPKSPTEIIPGYSVNLEGNGFAALRSGTGKDRRYLYLDYGIMGGEHGHPDRLQIGYYAFGRNWIIDPLNESYFNPNLQLWFRQTFAHTTPVVDQTSQTWTNGYGVFYGAVPSFQVASGASTTAYPGAKITRTLLQAGDYFLDLVDFESPDRRTVDWPLHSFGSLALRGVDLKPEPRDLFGHEPGIPGYDQLTDILSAKTDGGWSGIFSEEGQHLMVRAIGEKNTLVFQSTSPRIGGFYKQMVKAPKPMSTVLSRRFADTTRFAHLLHTYDDESRILGFTKGKRPRQYRVRGPKGEDVIVADTKGSEYWIVRSEGGVPVLVAGFGMMEILLGDRRIVHSTIPLSEFECSWLGSKLSVQTPGHFTAINIYAPGVSLIEVNGKPSPVERDGEYVFIRKREGIALEFLGPRDSTLFLGRKNTISVRVWNTTDTVVSGSLSLVLPDNWKEHVSSQVAWWGGVVNLLPLNKGSVTHTIIPPSYDTDGRWIQSKATGVRRIGPKSSQVFDLTLDIPNNAPPVDYRTSLRFGEAEMEKTFRSSKPVTASVTLPNGKLNTLLLTLTNNVSERITVTATVALDKAWKSTSPLSRKVTLRPLETRQLPLQVHFVGYSDENQLYPARIRIESGEFVSESQRDLYVGTAHHAPVPPSFDGSWRGWNRNRPMKIDKPDQIHKLLLGNQPWGGGTDLSARIYAMYDERYLYVGAEVTDQTNITTWNFPMMSYPWDTDCMEVVIDTRTGADQGSDPPTPGLFRHLSMAEYRRTEFPKELWRGGGAGGPLLPKPLLVQNAETYYHKTATGYSLICRYPLASLGRVTAKPGYKIGFDVAINDNDGTTYRKNTHIWAGYTSNQSWWDMGTIGVLIFGPKE